MFHPFQNTNTSELPQRFTYPFHYEAHPLCKVVAELLQEKLVEWKWNTIQQGKMFGVLIVRNKEGQLGYLWAYSGNLTPALDANAFVPPIFDLLNPTSFFITGEKELTELNKHIEVMRHSEELSSAISAVTNTSDETTKMIADQKRANLEAKNGRQQRRTEGQTTLSPEDFDTLNKTLIQESQREKSALKQLKHHWTERIKDAEHQLNTLYQEIDILKAERQQKSATLQQKLFDQYQLLNAKEQTKPLCDIFQESIGKQPPAAAGDCAAPRLLQYAYLNKMQPLAMAEFWWGKSPKTIIRKEGHYYPACRGKCEPILGHMLQGLSVDDNPMSQTSSFTIEIVYEDDALVVINKPSGLLSVQGKTAQPYVLEILKRQKPEITTPIVVHRLDMATSGLLIIAKDESSYKILQEQFALRQVKKRYEAILEGEINSDGGKINLPLRGDLDNRPQQMVCHEHGKAALTIWKKIEHRNGTTRVAFFPITGRTHQLRVHAAHPDGLNTPIVGDELYGTKAERLLLHAAQIEFRHPITEKKLKFITKAPF